MIGRSKVRRLEFRYLASALLLLGMPLAPAVASGQGWSVGATMPTCRSELGSAVLDGWVYVGGGLALSGSLSDFQRYRPLLDRWERRAPLPDPLHHFGMAAAAGAVYLTGGYDSLRMRPRIRATWRYDPAAARWERMADMPGPRAAHAMVQLDGLLFVVGGVGPGSADLWIYDPTRDRWGTAGPPLPTPREHLAAVALGGKLFVIGGRWPGQGNLATVEIFDPRTESWETAATLPTPRGGLTAAAVAGRIHVTGGEAFDPGRTFGQHEVYDPASGRWETHDPLPVARHGLTSTAVGGSWLVIGGGEEAGMRTLLTASCAVDIYTPAPIHAPAASSPNH